MASEQDYTVKVENLSSGQHITLAGRTTHTYSSGDGHIAVVRPGRLI